MEKITKKLIKYYLFLITIVIFLCFIGSSIFLSKFYLNQQYNNLKIATEDIYDSLKGGSSPSNLASYSAFISKNGTILNIGKGHMGMMSFIKQININTLQTKGTFSNPAGEEFLYYKLPTEFGDIIALQNSKPISEYIKITYVILLLVFLVSIVISIPLISYIGKKFTTPIIKLTSFSSKISNNNFDDKPEIKTKDEIEDLNNSLIKMSESLKKKYKYQRDFIANVSHDFRTPLSVIRNYSEAIKDGLVTKENLALFSSSIIDEVDRLNLMVNDILELSKFQEGSYKLNLTKFNLNNLIDSIASSLSYHCTEKNICIDVSYPSKAIYVIGDNNALARVLYNFIDNAIKFSYNDTCIKVEAKEYETKIKISVINKGIPISKANIDELWTKYYKNSESGGIGLGLPICKEILELHNFEYGVQCLNEGLTEFYFYIDSLKGD